MKLIAKHVVKMYCIRKLRLQMSRFYYLFLFYYS